ncbi:MAG: 3'-5' exonuclease [Campylobacterales bacterium]|nr:3'-5' exonuclease [Campylobacterales bacterium]
MLCYLDVETTGVEKKDRICSVGMILGEGGRYETLYDLVRPPKKVPPEAMAVHHLTNEMLADAPEFDATSAAKRLEALNTPETLLVGHNLAFDLGMLAKEGITWQGGMIDTLKCVKHLLGSEIAHFSLQYLRYELRLYQREQALADELGIPLSAHHALSDALHTMLLHRYLEEMADTERLMTLTTQQALVHKLTFGKYGGKFIEDIARRDPAYLEWMLRSLSDLDEDLRYSIEYYMNEVRG